METFKLIKNFKIDGKKIKINNNHVSNEWAIIKNSTLWKIIESKNGYLKLKCYKSSHDIEININQIVFKEYFRLVKEI